jgi:hypothetical protein
VSTIFCLKNLKRRVHSKELGAVGRIMLKRIRGNKVESCGLDASDSE